MEPVVEILSVSAPEEPPDQLRYARLLRPETGSASDEFVLDLAGTVIPREGQARSVEILADGVAVKEIPITFARPNVARSLPGVPDDLPCGFRDLLGALRLSLDFELELEAVLEDGARVPMCSLTGRRARPTTTFEPALRPIMVTSLGRSGTTWLMAMLAAHPSIVVDDVPPYERWPARYWTHMLKVMCDPTDPAHPKRKNLFDPDTTGVFPNPFYSGASAKGGELGRWLGRTYVERFASFCMHNIDDWYTIAARAQGKENPVYFAEKNFLSRPRPAEPVSELYPDVKEVFLVRDFRDMICSWISFHGVRSLGAVFGTPKLVDEIMPALARSLAAAWRARGEGAHLVRYEDLVFRPVEALRGLLRHLELDSSDDAIERMMGADEGRFESHGTSPALEKTVGRWRTEGDEAFRDHLNEVFDEPLAEFGYVEAVTGGTGSPPSSPGTPLP